MKILTKYILKEHIGPFVFASTALTSLMLLQFVGKRLGDLVGKGLPWHVLVQFFVLSMPLTVTMTLPMAVLVAVLYAYSRLTAENEITAMRASGISMRALVWPTLVAGFGVGLVMLVFNDQVLSRANHDLAVLQNDIARTKPSFVLKEQIINTVVDQQLYLRASRIDRASQRMRGVVIYDVADPAHRRTIYADSGTLGVAENGTDLVMRLYDGSMVEVPTQQPGQLSRLFYKRDLLRVRNVMNSFQASDADSASKGDREMSVCEMQARFADVDFKYRQARYDRLEAEAQERQLLHQQNIEWPAKPVPDNPFGLGKIYCGLVHRLFRVKTASAATLADRSRTGQQQLQLQQQQKTAQQSQSPQRGQLPPQTAQQITTAQQQAARQQQTQSTQRGQTVPPQTVQQGTTAQQKPTGVPPSAQPTAAAPVESVRTANGMEPILRQAVPAGEDPNYLRIQLQSQAQAARARENIEKYSRVRYDIEIQKKFSLAAACIIFVLLGPPIALRFPRGGVGLVIGVSFVVFSLYYVGLIGGETLADSMYISPFWAMWSANLILFVIGIVMTLRMNKLSGATRGGDWREIRDAVRVLFMRLIGRTAREAA